uniref:Uncharacterized protein n=1 Tax=Aegilops tauschii subsp. strangulata TaxID=200361 RepID=A0A453JJH6_AEGTS
LLQQRRMNAVLRFHEERGKEPKTDLVIHALAGIWFPDTARTMFYRGQRYCPIPPLLVLNPTI